MIGRARRANHGCAPRQTGRVGYLDVQTIRHQLSDGRVLLDDVNLRIGEGAKAALIGANGAGKTTLLRIIAGDLAAQSGASPGPAGSA